MSVQVGDKVKTKIEVYTIKIGMIGTVIRVPGSFANEPGYANTIDVDFGNDENGALIGWNPFHLRDLQRRVK